MWQPEEGIRFPRNGIIDHCEPSCGFWEWNHASLQEQMLLTIELSLQLLLIHLFILIIPFIFFRMQYNYIISSLSSLLHKPHLKLTYFSEANLFGKLAIPLLSFSLLPNGFL